MYLFSKRQAHEYKCLAAVIYQAVKISGWWDVVLHRR